MSEMGSTQGAEKAEVDTTIEFEVWRSHPKGRDVRLYFGMSEDAGVKTLAMCEQDKADGYPDAPIAFYLVRATTTRERLKSPERTRDA